MKKLNQNYRKLDEKDQRLVRRELANRRPKDAYELAKFYSSEEKFTLEDAEIEKAFQACISTNSLFYEAGKLLSNDKSLSQDELEDQVKEKRNLEIPEPSDFWTEKENGSKSFNPKLMGDFILSFTHIFRFTDDDQLYIYKDGVYNKGGENRIKSIVNGLLQDKIHSGHKQQTLDYLKDRTKSEINKPDHLNIENGRLHINGRGKPLKDHTPRVYDTYKLPVEYRPEYDCREFRQFLLEVTRDYTDFLTIQEMMGACLLKSYEYQKAFLLLGEGSNGKSTLLYVIEQLIGEEHISNTPLHDITGNRFSGANLHRKLVNIGGEVNMGSIKDTDQFKRLTGEDRITAENKFEKQFQFRNYATLIFAANKLPEVKEDVGRAFWRRLIPIQFPYVFTDKPNDGHKDKDPEMREKLTTDEELSGILNFALAGLHRLQNQDYTFTKDLSYEEVENFWLSYSDPKSRFFAEKVQKSPNSYEKKENVYKAYEEYCEEIGEPTEPKVEFGKFVNRQGAAESAEKRIDGQRVKIYRGIQIS